MVESGENKMVGIGKVWRDNKGAGRIYIPKEIMDNLDVKSGERVIIRVTGKHLEIIMFSELDSIIDEYNRKNVEEVIT